MADALTPYWGLTQPEIGASRDTWGSKLNSDLAALDTLLQALQPIGAMTDFAGFAAPTGWLLCDGTVYQVADYPRLFAIIGNFYGGDGVSTFAVPDARGRSTAGAGATTGDQGFVSSSVNVGERYGDWAILVAQINLPSAVITTAATGPHSHGGSTTATAGSHLHGGETDRTGDHAHVYQTVAFHNGGQDVAGGFDSGINSSAVTSTAGAHQHALTTTTDGDHQHPLTITPDGVHTHTLTLGSDQPLRVVPPMIAVNKIICCGPPSMQSLPGAGSTAMALMASPLRGLH
jgi:microcystin-dependent protein